MASDRKAFEHMTDALKEIERLNGLLEQNEAERRSLEEFKARAEELNRRQRDELAEADRRLENNKRFESDFLAGMSQEIRTPVNAVLGIAEIMLHNEHLTDQQKRYIGDIRGASESLLAVVGDILDLALIESAKVEPAPIHFNFRMMLNNICSRAQYLARAKGLEFVYRPGGEMPMYLFADDARCRQVIQGLLDNALTFTRRGSVTLETAVDGPWLRLAVADTGTGIREEEQPFVFEPFRQMDSWRNPGIRGTSLGLSLFRAQLNLALCKGLAVLLGGGLDFESVFGRGSVFRLTLPLVPGEEAKMASTGPAIRAEGGQSILALVVDDDEVNLSVASGFLKNLYGIDSDQAVSGRQALDRIRHTNYDLIFMDHMMPGLDGLETTARIRALGGKFKKLPIIALTANTVSSAREKLLASGFSDFLSKPLRKVELEAVLRKWVLKSPGKPVSPAAAPPRESSPSSILEKVAALDMMDVSAGIKTAANDRELYLRSLRILKDKIPNLLQLMEELLWREDLGELSVHFHTLKGSLAAVGGVALTRLAKNLEKAASDGDLAYVRNYQPPFIRLLKKLGDHLREIFGEEEGAGSSKLKGDPSFLKSGLKALQQALEHYDSDAVERGLRRLFKSDFGPEVGHILAAVRDKIEMFEYEAGAEILRTAFEDLF